MLVLYAFNFTVDTQIQKGSKRLFALSNPIINLIEWSLVCVDIWLCAAIYIALNHFLAIKF